MQVFQNNPIISSFFMLHVQSLGIGVHIFLYKVTLPTNVYCKCFSLIFADLYEQDLVIFTGIFLKS